METQIRTNIIGKVFSCYKSNGQNNFETSWIIICFTILALIALNVNGQSESATVTQSNACTPGETTQCFYELPKESYEAAVGSTVDMACKVRNRGGMVQWRQHQFLLGYERIIPINPRIRMIGSDIAGDYTLQITDVQKDDAGEYECQVTPVSGHPLLRRKTMLIVLVRPDPPQFLQNGIPIVNNHIIVANFPEHNQVHLTCRSRNGSPPPTFVITKGSMQLVSRHNVANGDVNFSIGVSQLVNNDTLTCSVSNKVTQSHHDVNLKSLNTSLSVTVHIRPGEPKLQNIDPGHIYREGENLGARCIATPVGFPQGGLFWRWYFPETKVYEDILPRYYTFQNDGRNNLISNLNIALRSRFHNSKLICETSHVVGPPLNASVIVRVKFNPVNVTIHSADKDTKVELINGRPEVVIYGLENMTKELTCSTSPYFGNVSLRWIKYSSAIRNNPSWITESQESISNVESIIPVLDEATNTWTNSSKIRVTIMRSDDKKYIDCRAQEVGGHWWVVSRARFEIVYAPEKVPEISGAVKEIKYGNYVDITCMSTGGNPLPDLTWYKGNVALNAGSQLTNFDTKQKTLTLRINGTKQTNQEQFHCKATSPAIPEGQVSQLVSFSVIFPPRSVTMNDGTWGSQLSPGWMAVVDEGDRKTVQCRADSSNPGAEIRWRRYDCPLPDTPEIKLKDECDVIELQGVSEAPTKGDFNGWKSQSTLTLNPKWSDHAKYIECQGGNPQYDATKVHDRMRLNVTFAPKFRRPVQQPVVKGTIGVFDVEPAANPPITRYWWTRNGKNFTGTASVRPEGGKLRLTGVDPSDMQNYTLVAENEKGRHQITFFLNVTYPPNILGDRRINKTINLGTHTHVDFSCQAQGNPAVPQTVFQWILPDGKVLKCNEGHYVPVNFLKMHVKCYETDPSDPFLMKSNLMVYSVNQTDTGIYKCVVDNGVLQPVTKIFEFSVPFKPEIVTNPLHSKAGGIIRQPVELTCQFKGIPKPVMTWWYGDDNRAVTPTNSRYRILAERLELGLYQTKLTVNSVKKSDFGIYKCQAENSMGIGHGYVTMNGTSRPDPPTNLIIVNSSFNALHVAWTQGFDGGLPPQMFTVKWSLASIKVYTYQEVIGDRNKIVMDLKIQHLESNSQYNVAVTARNSLGESPFISILAETKIAPVDAEGDIGKSQDPGMDLGDDNALLIIVAACVFGFVILVINILVISFLVKRRGGLCNKRPKNNANAGYVKADMVEMYPARQNGCTPRASGGAGLADDQKTFSSYDTTGSDDLKEDLLKKHEGHPVHHRMVGYHAFMGDTMAYSSPDQQPPYFSPSQHHRQTRPSGTHLLSSQPVSGANAHPNSNPMTTNLPGANPNPIPGPPGGWGRTTWLLGDFPPPEASTCHTVRGMESPADSRSRRYPTSILTKQQPQHQQLQHFTTTPTTPTAGQSPNFMQLYPDRDRSLNRMTSSYHRDRGDSGMGECGESAGSYYQNTGSLRLGEANIYSEDPNSTESPYHNLRGPFMSDNNRLSYAKELRRVQYSGIPGNQLPICVSSGSSLSRYPNNNYHPQMHSGYASHTPSPTQPHYYTSVCSPVLYTSSPQHPLQCTNPQDTFRPHTQSTPVRRQPSIERLADIIPPPQDLSRLPNSNGVHQADVVLSHQASPQTFLGKSYLTNGALESQSRSVVRQLGAVISQRLTANEQQLAQRSYSHRTTIPTVTEEVGIQESTMENDGINGDDKSSHNPANGDASSQLSCVV